MAELSTITDNREKIGGLFFGALFVLIGGTVGGLQLERYISVAGLGQLAVVETTQGKGSRGWGGQVYTITVNGVEYGCPGRSKNKPVAWAEVTYDPANPGRCQPTDLIGKSDVGAMFKLLWGGLFAFLGAPMLVGGLRAYRRQQAPYEEMLADEDAQ